MFVIYYRPGGNSVMCHFCCKTYKQLAALRRHCKEKHGVLAWIKEQQIFYEAHQKAKSEYYVCIEDREGAAAPSCHLLSSLHSLLLITFSIVDGCLYTVCPNKFFSTKEVLLFIQRCFVYKTGQVLAKVSCWIKTVAQFMFPELARDKTCWDNVHYVSMRLSNLLMDRSIYLLDKYWSSDVQA